MSYSTNTKCLYYVLSHMCIDCIEQNSCHLRPAEGQTRQYIQRPLTPRLAAENLVTCPIFYLLGQLMCSTKHVRHMPLTSLSVITHVFLI